MNQKLCTQGNKADKTPIMSGKDKLIIKRSNGSNGDKDNNIEESKHVMEHTPILRILSFEWQNTNFLIWDKSFTNKGRGWCNSCMGFGYAKKKGLSITWQNSNLINTI